jgi:hypothetical protein
VEDADDIENDMIAEGYLSDLAHLRSNGRSRRFVHKRYAPSLTSQNKDQHNRIDEDST